MLLYQAPVPLKTGARMSSFEPIHLTGANKGTRACPICTYVDTPGVQIWTDASAASLDRAYALAREAEAAKGPEKFVAFLVVDPTTPVADADLVARGAGLKRVAITRLASSADPAIGFHRFAPGRGPLALVYAKRRTTAVLADPRPGLLASAIEALR